MIRDRGSEEAGSRAALEVLCYAMNTLRSCFIVAHVHDELIMEADPRVSLQALCEQMARTPPWAKGLLLRADGFVSLSVLQKRLTGESLKARYHE